MDLSVFRRLNIKQKLLIAVCLLLGVGVIAGMISAIIEKVKSPAPASTSEKAPLRPAPSPAAAAPMAGRAGAELEARKDPWQACQFLAHVEGFKTAGYKSFGGDDYSCLTDVYKLGDDFPLPNTLTYFANGDAGQVRELELHLNVNVRSKAREAHEVLSFYGQELTRRALNSDLPDDIKAAITAGKAGTWKVQGASIELERDDWPTGKGYTLDFFIR